MNEKKVSKMWRSCITKIRDYRWKRKMTQIEMSQATGIAQCNISKIESCTSIPSIETVCMMCDTLGLNLTVEEAGDEDV